MMTGFLQSAREALGQRIEQFRNRPFLEATMAASALVAMADGVEQMSERATLDQALETIAELKIYDVHEAIDLYRDYVEALADDLLAGHARIISAVSELDEDRPAALILIKVCVAIAKSDDVLTDAERRAVIELCHALGVPREQAGI